MNERLEQLAVQAKELAEQAFREDGVKRFTTMEKFAELIVKECAHAIINDSRLNDVRSAANGCVRTIREHFGVEP